MAAETNISREQRLTVARRFIQENEPILDHGLARWEEIESVFGRGGGTGFLVATDRRLLFVGEQRRLPTSIGYGQVTSHVIRKKFATCDLRLSLRDGQVATFNGGKGFFSSVSGLLGQPPIAEPNEPTDLLYRSDHDAFACLKCHTRLTARWENCPGCFRTVDWESEATATSVRFREAVLKRRSETDAAP